MKVVIAGSRSFSAADYPLIEEVCLSSGYWYSTVISGTAPGVDRLGERFAKKIQVPVQRYPANWEKYGRSAGSIRNTEMARRADAVVVVWDGVSPGTRHMMNAARQRGLPLYVRVAVPSTAEVIP